LGAKCLKSGALKRSENEYIVGTSSFYLTQIFKAHKKALGDESESLRNKNEKSNMIECGSQLLYFRRRVDAMDR
jgi:hypothetical protein